MRNLKIILILAASLIICISNSFAYDFGINKTINDNRSGSGSWYGTQEDNEVEPGMINNQNWDLEGFYLRDSRYLSIVSGFNLMDGFNYGGHLYKSGDIFLDTNGNAQYGSSATTGILNYGYDYVIDVNWNSKTYNVYALSVNSVLKDVYDYNSPESSPWLYNGYTGVTPDSLIGFGSFTYLAGLTDAQVGVATGGNHYVAQDIDMSFLSFLPAGTMVTAHFTMECGNDNLMGQGRVAVPEPATLLLLGFGLVGICFSGRKFKK